MIEAGLKWLLATCLLLGACQSKSPLRGDAGSESAPLPLAASLQVSTAALVRLDITPPGREAVTLRRGNKGLAITAPLPYPANAPAVEAILAVLAEIEIQRRVSETAEPKHRLAPGAGIRVQAWTQASSLPAFIIGASQSEETYVQIDGDDSVYAVRGRCRRFFDLSLQALRDPTITQIDVSAIERVTYYNPHGSFTIIPDPSRAGSFVEATPKIPHFDSERATKNVAVLSALFAKGFVDAPVDKDASGLFAKDTARAEVTLHGRDTPLLVYIGNRSASKRLHLRVSDTEQVFLISAHLASSLIPKPEHFGRSAPIQAQSAMASDPESPAESKATHTHGQAPPTQVPAPLLRELRALARGPRN